MNEKSLTKKENDQLLNRGFFVKDFISFPYFTLILTQTLVGFIIVGILIPFLIKLINSGEVVMFFLMGFIMFFILILAGSVIIPAMRYLLLSKIFYGKNSIYMAGRMAQSVDDILGIDKYRISTMLSDIFKTSSLYPGKTLLIRNKQGRYVETTKNSQMILMGFIAVLNLFFLIGVGGILGVKIYILVLVLFYIGKILYDSSHPLYAFGNLGEKIQKLTPKIEEKSHEVQDNFQNDMNFGVLSDGFDSLSSDFSEIISLVIRIEKVEKRANKGNLFDSEKYINSLRSDIVKPLKFLKSFFEEQKAELLNSQKEFQKVRIGGLSELSSGSELSSKRNELILVELTENIGKLDEMIEKIG